ncbi:unnamed protein product [Pedinophyceae sp. YPF-701]|nr:unnamed protein product [Pedinophyceae sp. YPF-701]
MRYARDLTVAAVIGVSLCAGAHAQASVIDGIQSAFNGIKGSLGTGANLNNIKINGEPLGDGSKFASLLSGGFTKPAAVLQTLLSTKKFNGSLGTLLAGSGIDGMEDAKDIVDVVDVLEANYCTPPSFSPPERVPAVWQGPGASFRVETGSCSIVTEPVADGIAGDAAAVKLVCTKPSISVEKTKSTYTGRHITPATFSHQTCVLEKEFGDEVAETLYVFGSDPPSWTAIKQMIMDRLMSSFVGKRDFLETMFTTKHGGLAANMPGTA